MGLHTQVVTDWPTICGLAREWNDLLANSACNSIFLTWEWISTWYTAVAPTARLLTVAVRDNAKNLVGIGPFYITRMRLLGVLPYRVCRVLGDSHSGSEYPDFIVHRAIADEATAAVVQGLMDGPDLWDCIWMPRIASWTGAKDNLNTICARHRLYFHERSREFAAVELPEDYDTYFRSLSRNARASLRHRRRVILDELGASFHICDKEGDREGFLDVLLRLHRERWQLRGEEGAFIRKPAMTRFYKEFTRLALSRRWLRLYGLQVDGELQAVQIGYVYGNMYSQLQEGFSPAAPDGIGNVLRDLSIRSLIGEGVECYDFLGGFSEHKRRWRAIVRQGADVFIGRPNLKTRLLFYKAVWPSGRFIAEDHPADSGCQTSRCLPDSGEQREASTSRRTQRQGQC